MADDPNPALRAELLAALAVLAPQIRGRRWRQTHLAADAIGKSIDALMPVVSPTAQSDTARNVTTGNVIIWDRRHDSVSAFQLAPKCDDAADYASAMSEIRRLWDAPIGSADGDRLDVLVDLVIAYEKRFLP